MWQLTVENEYGVDITEYTSREAAVDSFDKRSPSAMEYIVWLEGEHGCDVVGYYPTRVEAEAVAASYDPCDPVTAEQPWWTWVEEVAK